MKRALIVNPYFDTLGGGEKYTTGVISTLEQAAYEVTIAWNDKTLTDKIFNRFGTRVHTTIDSVGHNILNNGGFIQKYRYLSGFDMIFWVSDGSVPFLFGKRNILLFQVPFLTLKKTFFHPLKLMMIHRCICYSQFTKRIIDATYGVDSVIIHPPTTSMDALPKKKTILSVGRFDGFLHNKRQDVLIEAFKQMKLSGWKLILAGGDMGQSNNLKRLRILAANAPIEIVVNPSHQEIETLYGEASLYWHAAGYGIDEKVEPEKMEHFGIATVEAMSAGTVPLVYQAGGQPEIVTEGKNGYLWTTVDELVSKTLRIITHPVLLSTLSEEASNTSTQFSMERFKHDFTHICIR